MSYAVEVAHLKKSYHGHPVLNGLSFTVKKGEIFALLGTNGAGKTTAFECIEGLRRYDGGTVNITGKPGIQLQSASLPEHIRPMEALRLFAEWKGISPNDPAAALLDIPALGRTIYADLSTGQKRRLHLALALLGDPDLLFLDEPTAGLDVEGRAALHAVLRRLKAQGKTIVLASHDMAEVEGLCDRIAILHHGELVFCGTVAELTAHTGGSTTVSLQTAQGRETFAATDLAAALLTKLTELQRKQIAVLDIQTNRRTLEECFINIAKGAGR